MKLHAIEILETYKLHEIFVSFYFMWKSLWLQVISHRKAAANGFSGDLNTKDGWLVGSI